MDEPLSVRYAVGTGFSGYSSRTPINIQSSHKITIEMRKKCLFFSNGLMGKELDLEMCLMDIEKNMKRKLENSMRAKKLKSKNDIQYKKKVNGIVLNSYA